jgi:hypothetical protein
MKRFLCLLALAGMASATFAQTPQPQAVLTQGTNDTWNLDWEGISGRTYFLQHSEDLVAWQYFPLIESGNDETLGWGFASSADKFFVRLRYTDIFTNDPDNADFDGDGLTNWEEIFIYGTDPFNADSDGDGMPDGWEVLHELNPNDPSDADEDPDGDGLTNLDEYLYGTDPNNPDSDGDGTSDGDEVDAGTDPNNPNDAPETGWVILVGNLDEDEEKTLNRTLRVPKGQRALLLVYVASDEYSEWTSPDTSDEFNDTLSWDIQPSSGTPISGSINVNARHNDWEEAEVRGLSFRSNSPIHIESSEIISASETEDLTFDIELSATNVGDGILPSTVAVALLPLNLREVGFDGDHYHELTSDDTNTIFAAPQWIDLDGNGDAMDTANGESNYSAAFTRNTSPKVESKFIIKDLPDNLEIKVKATASDGIIFPEKDAQVSGEDVVFPLTESTVALPDEIRYYPKTDAAKAFKIEWEIKVEDGGWGAAGESLHQMYVTLGTPITPLRQETLFYLGCKNGDGESEMDIARDAMFNEFTNQSVIRLDGVQMTYWVNNQMGCTDTSDLLTRADGNGNCQSWGGLFRDILRTHGIPADRVRVWPKNNDTSVIVKNWDFTNPPSGPPNHPYIVGVDATDMPGIAGQGNPNPPGSFNGHWITRSGGFYYDPSYGTPPVKQGNVDKAYEDAAFEGFGADYISGHNTVTGIRLNDTASPNAEVDYFLAN